MDDFRNKTLSGLGWSLTEQLGRQAIAFVVSVILARLLTPADFGLLGMIAVFTGFAALFEDLGFGLALVQRREVEERHFSSIFWINIFTGLLLAGLVIAAAPWIAAFYNEPRLILLTTVIALNFLIVPLSTVQHALLRRKMAFRSITITQILSTVTAGAVAITLAIAGYGVWALVWQGLVATLMTGILLWFATGWRPCLRFDRTAVSDLLGFSANLFGFNALNYWARKSDNLLVGKFLGSSELGVYARAYAVMLLPLSQVSSVLAKVMLPALARIQEDKLRVKRIYLRSIAMIALVTFPLMLGLLAVTDHFVLALYGPQWAGVIPVLRILCLVGMLQSIHTTIGWIFTCQGRTDWFFRYGLIASGLIVGGIAVGVWIGTVVAVAACYAVTFLLFLLFPSFAVVGKLIDMTVFDVVRAVAGSFGCAAAMAIAVWALGWLLPADWPHWAYLVIQVPFGVVIYSGLVVTFQLRSYRDGRSLAWEQWQHRAASRQPVGLGN